MQFPSDLPRLDRRDQTAFGVRDNTERFTNARGIDIDRPLTSGAEIEWTLGHGAYTEAQLRALIAFWRDARGRWFDVSAPATSEIAQFKFVDAPSGRSVGAGKFSVSVKVLERVL